MAVKYEGFPTQQYEALVKQIKEAMAKKGVEARKCLLSERSGRLLRGRPFFVPSRIPENCIPAPDAVS